ncbi:MAG: ferritin [Chloroflexi bacterium]|nr:ferritin [Chloroflexota bacterium]MDA1146244.1 ferritin [Chloroflexota bacterium]
MMISEAMAKAVSVQIGREYFAAIQYDMIAAYFERNALPELTSLFRAQADEELAHAQKFIDYVTEAGGIVEIPEIERGRADFTSVEEAVQAAHDNEGAVTTAINGLMDQAIAENDHLARGMLQWFVNEQLEEMSLQGDLLTVVRRAGSDLHYVEQYVSKLPQPAQGGGAA